MQTVPSFFMESSQTQIQTFQFHGKKPGKHLLVLGGIHGNEACGSFAIKNILEKIELGKLTLEAGTITFAPICNPLAFTENVRYIDHNLNRIIHPNIPLNSPEQSYARQVMGFINDADVVLDIHSFSTQGMPFIFQDNEGAAAFANALNFPLIMTGWPELYAQHPNANEGDTAAYAASLGKEAVVIECGQHDDPESTKVAENAILDAMVYAGLAAKSQKSQAPTKTVCMKEIIFKEKAGNLAQAWQHGQAVQQEDLLATYDDGEAIVAPMDSFMLMPKNQTRLGGEWFYLGVEI